MDTCSSENQPVEASLLRPLAKAAAVYRQEWCANTFEEDLCWHLEHGYVFSTPTCFLMGYQSNDTWHVSLCAGDLLEALSLMPYRLPWVRFERNNKLRYYKTERLYEQIARLYPRDNPLLQRWRECSQANSASGGSNGG